MVRTFAVIAAGCRRNQLPHLWLLWTRQRSRVRRRLRGRTLRRGWLRRGAFRRIWRRPSRCAPCFRRFQALRDSARPRPRVIGGRQFRAPQITAHIGGFNARRFGGGAAGANRFARLGNSEGLRAGGRAPRFAREQRLGRGALGHESARGSIAPNTRRNMPGQRFARNRGIERPGALDRNAASQFRGNELARRPFFAQRFAARGAATQALARELQPNQAFLRNGLPNNDAFRRGNGFEGRIFGGHHWQGREGRFLRVWVGGVFWPFLFGDYVSYAFWPDTYSEPFWAYGPELDPVGVLMAK